MGNKDNKKRKLSSLARKKHYEYLSAKRKRTVVIPVPDTAELPAEQYQGTSNHSVTESSEELLVELRRVSPGLFDYSSDTMNLDTVELINEIMIRPEIWMSKHPANKNKWKIVRKWEEMKNSKFPQYHVDDLKKRWKNIKDQYRKELKKLPQIRPGVPADNYTSNWKYFEYMAFLKDELIYKDHVEVEAQEPEHDPMVVGESSSGSSQSHVAQPEYRMTEATDIKTEASPSSQKSDEDAPEVEQSLIHVHTRKNTNQAPKEMREELLKIEQRKLSILESEIARNSAFMKSDNYHFLMSILPEMEKLPSVYKMRLRTKISQAVLEEVTLYEQQRVNNLEIRNMPENSVDIDIKEEPINMYD